MTIKRRTLLKTVAAGSVLLTTAGRSLALTSPTLWSGQQSLLPPVIHLQTNSFASEAFNRSMARASVSSNARDAIKTLSLDPAQMYDSVFVHQFIGDLRGHRVMGFMDDAGFTILHTIARSLGSRFLCSGQHSWGEGGNYHSRHQIVSVPEYQGVGAALAETLVDKGQGYFISEKSLGVPAITPGQNQNNLTPGEDWTAVLVEALTMISLDKWIPGKVGGFEHSSPVPVDDARQQITSFVIEL